MKVKNRKNCSNIHKKNQKKNSIHIYTLLTPLQRPVLSSVNDHHCRGSEFTRWSRRRAGTGSSLPRGCYGKDGGSIHAAVCCARLWRVGEGEGGRGCAQPLRQWRAVGIGRSRQTWRKRGVISNIPAVSFLLSVYLLNSGRASEVRKVELFSPPSCCNIQILLHYCSPSFLFLRYKCFTFLIRFYLTLGVLNHTCRAGMPRMQAPSALHSCIHTRAAPGAQRGDSQMGPAPEPRLIGQPLSTAAAAAAVWRPDSSLPVLTERWRASSAGLRGKYSD